MSTITLILPLLIISIPVIILVFIISFIWKKTDKRAIGAVSQGQTMLYVLLSFFVPVVGIILFFVWRNSHPERLRPVVYGLTVYVAVLLVAMFLFIVVSMS